MNSAKIAISMERGTVKSLDRLVKEHIFSSRSRAIQEAVKEKLERIERRRLSRECAKLDPVFEKAMAEEGLSEEIKKWPKY